MLRSIQTSLESKLEGAVQTNSVVPTELIDASKMDNLA